MQYNISVVDDDAPEAGRVCESVKKWARVADEYVNVKAYPSAEAWLMENEAAQDILLLDVEMGAISGIELAKRIREKDRHVQIAFITSHFEFVSEGYEVNALHYLTKPVNEQKLFEVLDRAKQNLQKAQRALVVKCEGETVKLLEDDIVYIESFLHYIAIHAVSGEYRVKESISAFEKKLSQSFFRAHRSYIVNLTRVEKISRAEVVVEGGKALPVSRNVYEDLNRAFISAN